MAERNRGVQDGAYRAHIRQKYLYRLVALLRRGRLEPATTVSARSRAVKLAADLSMAMTRRGRTEWSRAILGKNLFRLKKTHCQRRVLECSGNSHGKRRSASAKTRSCKMTVAGKKSVNRLLGAPSRPSGTLIRSHCEEDARVTVTSRMQTLRVLVPGSRCLDTPVFLTEAADYIVALKMQVQAMQALADCYSNSSAHAARQG